MIIIDMLSNLVLPPLIIFICVFSKKLKKKYKNIETPPFSLLNNYWMKTSTNMIHFKFLSIFLPGQKVGL